MPPKGRCARHCPGTALFLLVLCFLITAIQLEQKVFLPISLCLPEGFSQAFSLTVCAWSLSCGLCLVPRSPLGSHVQPQSHTDVWTWNITACMRSNQFQGMLATGKRGAPLGLRLAKQVTSWTPTRSGHGQMGWQLPHSYCWGSGLLQLSEQGESWLHLPAPVPMVALGQGCSIPTAHWALGDKNSLGRDCFQQTEPAPIAALLSFPLRKGAHGRVPLGISRMIALGHMDDTRIQGCLNKLFSAVTSCSKTSDPTFRSLYFHEAGSHPVNMPGLNGSSASASPSQQDSGWCYLLSSCHCQQS